MTKKLKEYRGFVWPRDDKDAVGRRVVVMARDATEAMAIAEEKYGKDAIISLRNEEDANRPR